jgi:hypothetical protein
MVGILVPLQRYHDRVAITMQHDVAFLDSSVEASKQFVIRVEPGARKIRVVNMKGMGTASIYLRETGDPEDVLESVEDWSFEYRAGWGEYHYVDIPLAAVEPDDYYLDFVQETGWGYFEYTLSHGGGGTSHVTALVIAFLLACSVVVGAALVALLAIRFFPSLLGQRGVPG